MRINEKTPKLNHHHSFRFFLALLLIFLIGPVCSQAQQDTALLRKRLDSLLTGIQFEKKDSIGHQYFVVQFPATFKGGLLGWQNYLTKNLNTELGSKYVKVKKGDSIVKASIEVSFIVGVNGLISDVKGEPYPKGADVHSKLIAEAVRVVAEGPRWEPAIQESFEMVNGVVPMSQIIDHFKKGFRKVIYRHKQNITFVVSIEK